MAFTISDLTDRFKNPKPSTSSLGRPSDDLTNNGTNLEGLLNNPNALTYALESKNWYTAKPYGFKATRRNGSIITMFLPISPSNLAISTNFATNAISTLYGTVEEHSEVRYFDISIEGTTGMAPRFAGPYEGEPAEAYPNVKKLGRSTIAIADTISAGGFFAKTLNAYNQLKKKASDLVSGAPKARIGLAEENSGYVAFHNLYRFLLQYKKDAAGTAGNTGIRGSHPLTFFNYKDNNQYDVVVRNFTMKRSSDNPMLYNYSIQLRGYNIRSITSPIDEDLSQRLKDLGLNGIDSSSILGSIKSLSRAAKSIIGSAVGGINQLGR
jgi:hypothetical protein